VSVNPRKAPFPWFGGKSQAAPVVWAALGDVDHYVEPFAGALGVLLNRPHPANRPYHSETVNDLDGFVVNAWRAIQWSPEATAEAASWPVTEADKQARQIACLRWRTDRTLDLLAGDATWHDPLIAGWWLYGVCCQIGAFSGDRPWTADPVTGRITNQGRPPRVVDVPGPDTVDRQPGVSRDRPHLSDNGQGVNRPQGREPGVSRARPHLGDNGRGVNHAGTRQPGVAAGCEFHPVTMPELVRWFEWLAARLRHVRIVNGDWTRVITSGAAHTIPVRQGGHAGIFLDPPYDTTERARGLYAQDITGLADHVRTWAQANGDNPKNRIVLAGYDTEHSTLEQHDWTAVGWFTDGYLTGGMGKTNQGDGTHQQDRERLWLSPHCLTTTTNHQPTLLFA
jgi:site-specific DNA-adenine methylase